MATLILLPGYRSIPIMATPLVCRYKIIHPSVGTLQGHKVKGKQFQVMDYIRQMCQSEACEVHGL